MCIRDRKNDGIILSFDINSVRWAKNYPLGRFLYTSKYRKNNFLVFIKKFFKNFFPHPDKCTHPFGICVKGKQELCLLPTGGEGGELLWSNPLFKMSRQSDISLILCASWHWKVKLLIMKSIWNIARSIKWFCQNYQKRSWADFL